MNWTLFGGIALVVVISLALKAILGRGRKTSRTSYQKQDFLFSPEERLFLTALREAVGDEYEIFGKIPADEIITPRPGRGGHPPEPDTLADYLFDFLLCRKPDLAIACAVRLVEHSNFNKHHDPDPLKHACHAAGLPLASFATHPLYDAQEIAAAIAEAVRQEPVYVTESTGRKEPRISGLDNLDI